MNSLAFAVSFLAIASCAFGDSPRNHPVNCLETYMVMHVSLQPSYVQEWVNYTRQCAKENNVGPEICEGLLKRQYPDSEDEACFFGCFAEKINVVLADATNLNAIKTSMSDMQFQKANECLKKHSPPTEDRIQRCWNVYKTHQCYMAAIDKPAS